MGSSPISMAAHRLNPFPATPFSRRGMSKMPAGWALPVLRKASFLADSITKLSTKAYVWQSLLTFQFFYFRKIMSMQIFTCLWLHEKNNLGKKKHLCIFGPFWGVFASCLFEFNMSIRCETTQQKKYSPVRTYFLMLCCLVIFALAIDMAVDFLVGGPILRQSNVDFEEDGALTMMICW